MSNQLQKTLRRPRKQMLAFDEWWPLVMKLWRQKGRLTSIPEKSLRWLYENRFSPLEAIELLLTRADEIYASATKEPT